MSSPPTTAAEGPEFALHTLEGWMGSHQIWELPSLPPQAKAWAVTARPGDTWESVEVWEVGSRAGEPQTSLKRVR